MGETRDTKTSSNSIPMEFYSKIIVVSQLDLTETYNTNYMLYVIVSDFKHRHLRNCFPYQNHY